MQRTLRAVWAAIILIGVASSATGQGGLKPLDHDVYDSWKSIRSTDLSRDGRWLVYLEAPQEGDGDLFAKSVRGDTVHRVPRGTSPRLSRDGRFVVLTIVPAKAEVDQAKKEKKKPNEMPKNALGILDLETGNLATIPKLRSVRVPNEDAGWIAYQVEVEPKPAEPKPAEPKPGEAKPGEPKPAEPKAPQKKKGHTVGSELILRELSTGREEKLADVAEYVFSKDGKTLLYAVSTKTGEGDGLYARDLVSGATRDVMTGMALYRQLTIHDGTGAFAFLTDKDDYASEDAAFALYVQRRGQEAPRLVAKEGSAGLPSGWALSNRASLRFSDNGARVVFGTAPKPPVVPKEEEAVPDDEKVVVDIWNWRDPELQPMQLLRANAERNRTYDAVALLDSGKLVQLETPDLPSVTIGAKLDGAFAVGTTNLPYRQLVSWDGTYNDVYFVNVADGSRRVIAEKLDGIVRLSPTGRFAYWWDPVVRTWFTMDASTGRKADVTPGFPYALHDEEHDTPDLAGSYGSAGWTDGDPRLLIYDKYDVWSLDPSGEQPPVCVTDGVGRGRGIRFRVVTLDRERDTIDPAAPLLLSALSERTKASGYWRDTVRARQAPVELIMGDKRYGSPTKADEADVLVLTREDFREFPDLWVTDSSFANLRRMSDANPQQAQYAWGAAELVEYTSLDGVPLQGILVKPADFDPGKRYPMIVYFYERLSDGLHRYYSPSPSGGASANPSFYASRGYLVLMPDIPYKTGYPGESAMNAILPAVQHVMARGYVDVQNMAITGHSWGGYQTVYLVTRTNLFRCAVGGAVVSNMTSAYGGIRWGSGMVRQFQYEKTQSRIGGSLWERPLQFMENSPIFWADKVQTPLLLIHNDSDGAVPWYQGIEFFTALRRLQKPVWMLNYNGEDHGLGKRQNRKDWSIRMQQFYDHYLKGEPAPVWLVQGVPAVDKGKDLGLGLVKGGG